MNAKDFLKEKYKQGGCNPWSLFSYNEVVENMEEYAQQLKILNIPVVKASLLDKDNYDYLRGFSDGYGGPEPHECFPEGFKNINQVMDRMWKLGKQRQ